MHTIASAFPACTRPWHDHPPVVESRRHRCAVGPAPAHPPHRGRRGRSLSTSSPRWSRPRRWGHSCSDWCRTQRARPRSVAATSRGGDCRRHLGRRAANGLRCRAPAMLRRRRQVRAGRLRKTAIASLRRHYVHEPLSQPGPAELPRTPCYRAPGRFERSPEGAARTRNETDRNDIASALLSLVRIDFLVGSRGGTITKRSRTREDPFPHLAMPGIACPTYTYHMKRVMGSE